MINAERAALYAPSFKDKLERTRSEKEKSYLLTRKELLTDICKRFPQKKRFNKTRSASAELQMTLKDFTQPKDATATREIKEVSGLIERRQFISDDVWSDGDLIIAKPEKGFKMKIREKLERGSSEKVSIRGYANRALSHGRRLYQWTTMQPSDFDGVEFLYLLNQVSLT